MSARDELLDAGARAINSRDPARQVVVPLGVNLAPAALDAFLAHPDDLLAVMVEEGVLEQVDARVSSASGLVWIDAYRLIEGNEQ